MTFEYVYGHSDDLIEIEGVSNDERYLGEQPYTFMVGGVELGATYDGTWEFEVFSNPLGFNIMVLPNEIIDTRRFNDYTELVVIER